MSGPSASPGGHGESSRCPPRLPRSDYPSEAGSCSPTRCPVPSASSAIRRARASEEVAAGEGALRTCSARSVRVDDEVVDQRAVAGDRLGADAGRPGETSPARSSGTKRRSSPTNARGSRPGRARRQRCASGREQPPGARPGEGLGQVAGPHPPEPVGVARADQQRRGAEQDLAVDPPGQVHAEEGEVGVGHRVDAGPDQVAALGTQPQVGAPEGNDARLGRRAAGDREPVRPGARAADAAARAWSRRARGRSRSPRPAASEPATPHPVDDAARRAAQLGGEARRHLGEVDDAGLGRVQRPRSRPRAARSRAARRARSGAARDPVLASRAAPARRAPASSPSSVATITLPLRSPRSRARRSTRRARARPHAEPGLQRARPVVDPRVDHAAGPAGLVRRRSPARARAPRPACRRGAAAARGPWRGRRSPRRRRRRRTQRAAPPPIGHSGSPAGRYPAANPA